MRQPGDLIPKDPASDEPQGFDWTAWLLELGPSVTIAVSTWAITGPDAVLTKHDETIVTSPAPVSRALSATQMYYAAGTLGAKYTVTNHVETNTTPPVKDERSFDVTVEQR